MIIKKLYAFVFNSIMVNSDHNNVGMLNIKLFVAIIFVSRFIHGKWNSYIKRVYN